MEANQKRGDSTLAAKPNRSVVKIDSISIDLISANERTAVEKCDHFSIRGYVAEVRKRDKNICWPFASDENSNKLEEQICMLPPLDVPKFRSWHCQNCLQEIATKDGEKETAVVSNCSNSAYKSNGTCLHMEPHGDETMLLLEYPRDLHVDISQGRKAEASPCRNVKGNENRLSLCSDKQEKLAVIACGATGVEHHFEDHADQIFPKPPCSAGKANPCLVLEKHADDIVTLDLNFNGSVELLKPHCRDHEVADDIGLTVGELKSMVNGSTETCQTGKQTSMDNQHKTVCGSSKVVTAVVVVDEAFNSANDLTSEHPLLELDDSDHASAGSDEILARNSLSQHIDNSKGLPHRKSRKVRLLTELLGASGNNSPSTAMFDASTSIGSLSVPQGESAVKGNARRGFRGKNRKRKTVQDEDWRPHEVQHGVNKRVRTFKRDVEITDINIAIDDAESEEDEPAGIGSPTGIKSHLARHKINRTSVSNKRRNKKTSVDDGCSSFLSPQAVTARESQDKIGDAHKGNAAAAVLSKSGHDASKGKTIEPFLKSFPAQQTERKSCSSKKKNKTSVVEDGQASLLPWKSGMVGEDLITRKEAEYLQSRDKAVSFQSKQDHSAGKDPQLFLDSLTAQRSDAKHVATIEDGLSLFLSQQESIHREDTIPRKDVVRKQQIGGSSIPFKSTTDMFFGVGVNHEISSKGTSNGLPFLSENQYCSSRVEDWGSSLKRNVDFSGGKCNKEKSIDVAEPSEQGISDDIPMEIVELMARNQYERCLPESKSEYHCSAETTYTSNAAMLDFSKGYANGPLRFFQEENIHQQKSQSSYGRNSISKTAETARSSQQKSVGHFSDINRNRFNMVQPEETHGSVGGIAFPVCQDKLSSGIQFSAAGSSRHGSAPNCKWARDMAGHRFCTTSLSAFEAYNTGHSISRQSEDAAHVWSSMTTNHMPFGFGYPEEYATLSGNMDVISHSSDMLQKSKINGDQDPKFFNLNAAAADDEREDGNIGSETLHRSHMEYSFPCKDDGIKVQPKLVGSLDLYSNENIPAMHLLSLMDSRRPSRTRFNMDGDSKFLKKPVLSHDYGSRLEIGAYKSGNTSRQPSSEHCGKNHLVERSCACSLALGPVGAFASSTQNDGSFKPTGLIDQVPPRLRGKEKSKGLPPPVQDRGHRSRKSSSTRSDLGANPKSTPTDDVQKRFPGASNAMLFPLQSHTIENSTEHIAQEMHSNGGTSWPMKSRSETAICSINKNPAEFSLPEAGNIYMIGGEDLKFGKSISSGNRAGSINMDGHKRKRSVKLTSVKERARRQKS